MAAIYDYDAVAKGAGLGVFALTLLARRRFKMLVCEYTDRVGGCSSSYGHDGFRSDIVPAIAKFRPVFVGR